MAKGLMKIVHTTKARSIMIFDSVNNAQGFCQNFTDYLEPKIGTEQTKKFPLNSAQIGGKSCLIIPSKYFPMIGDYLSQQE